jgi:hypothetical protein
MAAILTYVHNYNLCASNVNCQVIDTMMKMIIYFYLFTDYFCLLSFRRQGRHQGERRSVHALIGQLVISAKPAEDEGLSFKNRGMVHGV